MGSDLSADDVADNKLSDCAVVAVFEELFNARPAWTMETQHVAKDFILNILGGWCTKAHDPQDRENDNDMDKARTKKSHPVLPPLWLGLSF